MSITDRINLRQDRRQWIKRSAGLVGASVLPLPAVASPAEQEKPEGPPSTDIAAVLTVIRRRPRAGRTREQQRRWHFDLRADLRGIRRGVVLRGHFDDVAAHDVETGQRPQDFLDFPRI